MAHFFLIIAAMENRQFYGCQIDANVFKENVIYIPLEPNL